MKKKFSFEKNSLKHPKHVNTKVPARFSMILFLMMFAIVVGVLSSFVIIGGGLQSLFGENKKEVIDSNQVIDTNNLDCGVDCNKNPSPIVPVVPNITEGSEGGDNAKEPEIIPDPNQLVGGEGGGVREDSCLEKCRILRQQCNSIGEELKPDSTGCYIPDPLEPVDGNCEVNCFAI